MKKYTVETEKAVVGVEADGFGIIDGCLVFHKNDDNLKEIPLCAYGAERWIDVTEVDEFNTAPEEKSDTPEEDDKTVE